MVNIENHWAIIPHMPASSIASAIVSSIVTAILESPTTPTEPVQTALMRPFPSGTATGKLAGPPSMGQVVINGKTLPVAPALQIRNEMNMIVIPTMVGTDVQVRYQMDGMGNVWRIWLLTPAEVAALDSQ